MGEESAAGKAELLRAADLPTLNARFRRALAPYRFNAYAAAFLHPPEIAGRFLLLDWPRAWLELYAARGFAQDDIVVAEAQTTSMPFTWTEIRQRRPGVSAHIFAAAAEFGWRDGLLVPVHGPGPARAAISLAAPQLDLDARARSDIVALSLLAFERARALEGEEMSATGSLTGREREALALAAAGRTDPKIAAELRVSKSTAHFHVENAKRRLGARTRAHAVALALVRGLI